MFQRNIERELLEDHIATINSTLAITPLLNVMMLVLLGLSVCLGVG